MKSESEVQQEVQMTAMHSKCTLMRNNSGCLLDADGRPVRYGLGNVSKKHNDNVKSSDLIGITKVTITKDMIGKTLGVFTALEVKKEGWNVEKKLDARERAQHNFIDFVKHNGGYAGFISDVNEIKDILK